MSEEERQAESASTTKLIRVGVLSDTHGVLSESAYAALAGSDHIIHAGDIGDPQILRELETLAPVTAVWGNNDFNEYGKNVGRFARPILGGVRFLVAHYPQDVTLSVKGGPGLAPGDPIPQICIHGHTHVPRILTGKDAAPAQYLICPGSVFRPRGGAKRSIVKIAIENGKILDVALEEIAPR